jgi:AcrR family transcriptional regulator
MQQRIAPRDDDRHRAILWALFQCMRDKGYTSTSLADVAAAARISPSHLLYYFPNKDAVLEALFDLAAKNMLRDVAALPGRTPDQRCDALADYFFGGRVMTRPEQGVMLQFFGLATHNRRLWQIKSDFDRHLKAHLESIFHRDRSRVDPNASDVAEIAHAMLVGLFTSSYFDERLELATAHRLFRETLARLASA